MKLVVFAAVIGASVSVSAAPQGTASARSRAAQPPAASVDQVAQAYDAFLLARHYESEDKADDAIAAYKRAIALDPSAADVTASLAALYMHEGRAQDAITTAEQALKLAPANREAHRVLGLVYAALADSMRGNPQQQQSDRNADVLKENLSKAIANLEQAVAGPVDTDPNARATLARLYVRNGSYDKAIPILTQLVADEPGWEDGPALLAQAYAGAGRMADAIAWLERAAADDPDVYPTLADFYERQRRWKDAAATYAKALKLSPKNVDLQTRYASALLNAGGRDNATTARDVLSDVLAAHPNDVRVLYLRSQAERRLGDLTAAETDARTVMTATPRSPWGYYALAEVLEQRRQFQAIVDALTPALAQFRSKTDADAFELGLLLPHVGFAYQELGEYDKAIATFQEAHKLAPQDAAVDGYLIDAMLAAKKFTEAASLAAEAHSEHPDSLRIARLDAQALRETGKADQGLAVLEDVVKRHENDSSAYIALAQAYADADKTAQAEKLLHDAEARFPDDTAITFELGTVYDKAKKYDDAVVVFRQLIAREPDNAAALNYLGYMLAERGEHLDESVNYLRKALQIEPDNGSYLDSLGWAYFKADKLELAEDNLRRAADQLMTNSVVQDHYGELLFKLGRYTDAIAAWTRALNGDGEEIDRSNIDRKIRAAKQKLDKK